MKKLIYPFSIALFLLGPCCNETRAQNGFSDNFELYPAGSFPTNWSQSGNNAISVDNSTSYSGTNSLRMFGVLGGCWASVAHRNLNIGPAWQLTCRVKNGGERGTGCHPDLGVIAVNTGPSWTLPNLTFLAFRAASGETNQLQIVSPANGAAITVGSFNTNQWYKVRVLYQPVGPTQVEVTFWLDDILIANNLYTNLAAAPTNFTYLSIASGEGTTWFDDVTVTAPSNSPPVIVQQPLSLTINQGDPATFSALATGSLPLSYQWQFNGGPLPGQTNAALTLPNAQTNEAGLYSVLVTNSFGSAVSSNAILTVRLPYPITCGQTVTNTTSSISEADAYSFNGVEGQPFVFALAGGISPAYGDWMVADIYSPEGQLLATVDGGSGSVGHTLSLTLTNSGTFNIRVHESLYRATGTYALSMQSVTGGGCDTTPLHCGQSVANSTTRMTQMDAYSLNGTTGQRLSFALAGGISPAYGDWMVADIYTPGGQFLGTVDGGSGSVGHALDLTLTESGTFTILVHESLYRAAGKYSLSIQSLSGGGCDGVPLSCGQTATNTTSQLTQMDAYSYSATAGQQLSFALAGGISPAYGDWMVADIYTPGGQFLGNVDGGSGGLGHALDLILTNSGTYTILVHESLYRAAGKYSLSIQSVTDGGCQGVPISCGQTVTNTTSRLTQMDAYNYSATAGQQLSFALAGGISPAYGDWMIADIYNPEGRLLGTIDGGSSGIGHALDLTLTNSGILTILVHESLYRAVGTYSLTIQSVRGGCGGAPVSCGQSVTNTTSRITETDAYSYSGIAGQQLLFALAGGISPAYGDWMVADIYNPGGQFLGTVDGGSSGIGHALDLTLTNSGVYTILVHESLYRATGSYSLSLQSATGGGCSGTYLNCGQGMTNATRHISEMDAYGFNGASGQQLVFWLDGPISAAYGDWMVADIYSPGGQYLGTIDGGSANIAHTLTLTLTNTGIFTFLLHESLYRSVGAYELSVQSVNGPGGGCGLVPPAITKQPQSLTSYVGGTASFSVVAEGSAPLSYQWDFNGTRIPGATNSTFSFNVQSNSQGSYTVEVTNLVGSILSSNATLSIDSGSCYTPPSGLIAWWPGDGNAMDIVGGHNGQPVGSVSYTNGLCGKAFYFSGAGTIQVPDAPDLDFAPHAPITLEVWAYRTGSGDPQHFLGKRIGCIGNTDINYQMAFNMGAGEGLVCEGVETGQPMPLNSWHHLVGSFDGTNGSFYLDGQLLGTGTGINGPTNNAPLLLGGSGTCADFEGFMQNVRIYNRALSAEEVDSLYQAGCSGVCLANVSSICADAILGLTGAQTNNTVQLGQPFNYRLTAFSKGECNPTGVMVTNQLPSGFQFVSATISQGTWNYDSVLNQLVFNLGSISTNQSLNLDVSLMAIQIGTFTNTAVISYDSTNPPVVLNPPVIATVVMDTNPASPPVVTRQPINITTNQGASVTFSVLATGTQPLSYQWSFNSNSIPGGTNSTLTLPNVQTNENGFYSVSLSNVAGSTNSSNAVLIVIPAPIVSIMSPTSGADFSLGTGIPFTATAIEPGGTIARVMFIANGNTILRTVTSSPYSIIWTNASLGTQSIEAVATDGWGISGTSAPVSIEVTLPVVPPSFTGGPDLTMVQNAGPQSFTNWATSINPGTPAGTLTFVVNVDNSSLFSAPPTLSTNGTLFFLPAPNAAGVAHCRVVLNSSNGFGSTSTNFTLTVVAPKDVAIILSSADVDPGPVTNDVGAVSLPGEQSLSFETFQRSQLSSPVLSLFKLILWYDPDGTQPVSPLEVSLLQNLYSNGLPFIFVGPKLVSSGAELPVQAQTAWQELLHLQADNTPPISGTVNPAGASGSGTSLPSGAYGLISPFSIQTSVDEATVTSDADSCGQLGTNDVIASFPSVNAPNADLLVRTFTELLPLGQDTDSQSFSNRNNTLQNGICWVLHCGACPAVFLSFGVMVTPNAPQTGQPVALSFALGNNGECDGAAYRATIQLDKGLRLVSAASDYGHVTTISNFVSVYVGRIPARQNINLTLTVLPVIPGSITNQIQIVSASAPEQDFASIFQVQGERIPELSLEQNGPNTVLISVWAQAGVTNTLERAALQPQGGAFIWTPLTNFIFADPVFQMQDTIQPVNSGSIYRVRTR